MAWPSADELSASAASVAPALKEEAHNWLKKFIRPEYLPADIEDHMVAMKAWGRVGRSSEEERPDRRCDVFLVRYRVGDHVIQIQESPYNVIMTVSDERLAESPRQDRRQLVEEVVGAVLNKSLASSSSVLESSESLNVLESSESLNGKTGLTVSWVPASIITEIRSDGLGSASGVKMGEVGLSSVHAQTDGRFVRFSITKNDGSAAMFLDPYNPRFTRDTSADRTR
jgi:hypothetical protein